MRTNDRTITDLMKAVQSGAAQLPDFQRGWVWDVSHFPPGTSQWNKIEHRFFSQISKNWRGRPLEMIQIIVNLIASTTTKEGLTVQCTVDGNVYERGIKISDEELKALNLTPNEWHGEWNYIIAPQLESET